MSTPSIKVGQGNWGIKAGNLLGYANTDKKFVAREFTVGRLLNTATRVNASGNIEGVNANIPRIDYFGGQASLLVEPSGTNSIRNNSMVGAVTGTPGTAPNNWSISSAGLTQTIVGTGTENGVQFIDFRFNGTATGTLAIIEHDLSTQIVASDGQTWTYSTYAKLVSAPTPAGAYRINIREFTATGGTVAEGTFNYTPTSSLARYSATRTLSGGPTVARVAGRLYFTLANGSPYDFTIRIGYPQMEQSSVATSVIPTTTGSVNRNADVISVTGVAGLIGQTEGTIYMEVDYSNNSTIRHLIALSDGSSSNRIRLRITAPTTLQMERSLAGSNAVMAITIPSSGIVKIALGYSSVASGFVVYVNGLQQGIIAAATATFTNELNRVNLGSNSDNAGQLNDRIRAVEIYQTRLPNTTTDGSPSLQSITTL